MSMNSQNSAIRRCPDDRLVEFGTRVLDFRDSARLDILSQLMVSPEGVINSRVTLAVGAGLPRATRRNDLSDAKAERIFPHLPFGGSKEFDGSLPADLDNSPRSPMQDTADTARVLVRPPIAWGLAVIAGLALNWLAPLPLLPAFPAAWLGAIIFVLALALFAWAVITMTRSGSNVPTNRPTTTIVENGPYRFTRNPIYLGMFLGLGRGLISAGP